MARPSTALHAFNPSQEEEGGFGLLGTDDFQRPPESLSAEPYLTVNTRSTNHDQRLDHTDEGPWPVRGGQRHQPLLRDPWERAAARLAARRPWVGRDVRTCPSAARGAPPGRRRRPARTWSHR